MASYKEYLWSFILQDCGHPALDYDMENTAVCDAMVAVRGPCEGRRSFIAGPSTRNQRMERLWRDISYVFAMYFTTHFINLIQYCRTDTTC